MKVEYGIAEGVHYVHVFRVQYCVHSIEPGDMLQILRDKGRIARQHLNVFGGTERKVLVRDEE